MHKMTNSIRIISLLVIFVGIVVNIDANPQRGPPPPGYFQYGGRSTTVVSPGQRPPVQSSLQAMYGGHSSPQPQLYKKPSVVSPGPGGPSNIMGWLGSQMAKNFPSFTSFSRPRPSHPFSQKYKQQSFGRPASPFGKEVYGGGSINSVHGSGYMPPANPPVPSAGMTPQNTIFQIISADGSSRYQAAPPPGYENFFGQQGAVRQALRQSSPPPPHRYLPAPQPLRHSSAPIYEQQEQQQPGQQQIMYHYQNSPGQQPLYGTKSVGNIEVLPSKMVSYEKQTLSTGHPEYQAAVDGMGSAASASNGYPVYYQQQQQQINPSPSDLSQQQYDYRPQVVQRVNENLGSMLQGVAPDVAPIYDLSTLQGQSGQAGQEQQDGVEAASPSNQEPIYAQAPQDQQQPQQQSSPSYLDNQDTQADYSHQSAMSIVPPPSNFQYQGQSPPEQQRVLELNSEMNNQVQILNHGANIQGNPTFEVIADADAPKFNGGHPFDITKFISMIEPGAQVDPKDIVSEDQENAAAQQYPGIVSNFNRNNNKQQVYSNQEILYKPKDKSKKLTTTQTSSISTTPKSSFTNFLTKFQTGQSKNDIVRTTTTTQPDHLITTNLNSKIKFPDDSNNIGTTPTTTATLNYYYDTFDKNDNHNYKYSFIPYDNSSSSSVKFPPVNPLFDSVISKDNEFIGDELHYDDVDDPTFDESRQYAITVTPPSHMFNKENRKKVEHNNNRRNVTAITNIVVSSSRSQVLNSPLDKKVTQKQRFPVYQRTSSASPTMSTS